MPHYYFERFADVCRQLGAPFGIFLVLLSAPGVFILLFSGVPYISSALRISMIVVSGFVFAIGVYLVFVATRISLLFGLWARLQLLRGRNAAPQNGARKGPAERHRSTSS
jgi:hypothetical protein